MDDHSRDAVGADISKTRLDAFRLNEAKRFVNDAGGFEDFAAWVGTSDAVVAYESAGHCHRDFEERCPGGCGWRAAMGRALPRGRWRRGRRRSATSTT